MNSDTREHQHDKICRAVMDIRDTTIDNGIPIAKHLVLDAQIEVLERMRKSVVANEEVLGVMGLGYLEDIDQQLAALRAAKEGKEQR